MTAEISSLAEDRRNSLIFNIIIKQKVKKNCMYIFSIQLNVYSLEMENSAKWKHLTKIINLLV